VNAFPGSPVVPEPPAERTLEFAVAAMRGVNGTRAVTMRNAPSPGTTFRGAAADSREVRTGNLFFALPGERVDGFDYCGSAQASGAAAVIVEATRGSPPAEVSIPVISVEDPRIALGELARAVRREFSGRVVGVTGSNGKTTTKELCAAALGAGGTVLRTRGNLNTEIGLPLTILSATGRESFWVLEMAMRGRGQIALLADIARPDVGVITNVAGAHLELLGSIEAVARAKGELFAQLGRNENGIAVLPAGEPLIEAQAAHLPESRKVRFEAGHPPGADGAAGARERIAVLVLESFSAGAAGQVIRFSVNRQPVVTRLPLVGAHNAWNAAAALAVASALGVPAPAAARALAQTVLPPHRSFSHAAAGRVIIDDCYNANPASMRAALTMLLEASSARGEVAPTAAAEAPIFGSTRGVGARAFAILGDMLELGPETAELHHAMGREFGARLAGLAAVGPLAEHIAAGAADAGMPTSRIVVAREPGLAAEAVASWTRPGDWILVKASRGMRLERAVEALLQNFATRPE
jgi:UDP-N-acetylmuramoyl-tripeptide--D-alanyl-D-alanine ligase